MNGNFMEMFMKIPAGVENTFHHRVFGRVAGAFRQTGPLPFKVLGRALSVDFREGSSDVFGENGDEMYLLPIPSVGRLRRNGDALLDYFASDGPIKI
jgi:hypothetical protein